MHLPTDHFHYLAFAPDAAELFAMFTAVDADNQAELPRAARPGAAEIYPKSEPL